MENQISIEEIEESGNKLKKSLIIQGKGLHYKNEMLP